MKSIDKRSIVHIALRTAQLITIVVLLAMLAIPAHAQQAPQAPATLTLDEAIRLARRYNPQYRIIANDAGGADWQVRAAYAQLLPSVNVGGGLSYQLAGTERIGNFEDVTRPAAYGSSYQIGGGMQISGRTFFNMAQARAGRSATDARITAAGYQLADDVTRAYLAAKRTSDEVALREQQLKTAQEAQKLAQARFDAGDRPRLDAAQAEVASGRAEVDLLQAQNTARSQRRALLQLIGVELDRDVELTTGLAVFEPKWSLDELTATAMSSHPQLLAVRAAESASKAGSRAAAMSYLPSINLNGSVYGYTRATADDNALVTSAQQQVASQKASCESNNELNAHLASPLPGYPKDCSIYVFTDADRQAALASNKLFPFNFTKTPASFSMSISLPIFNGFSRELQTEQARAQAQDAEYTRRAEELNRRALVANAFDAVQTAYRTVGLEERNTAVGQESLDLAQGRYAAGAGNIYELMQAQTQKAQADQARLVAVYTFHEAVAQLENAVGKPLRPETQKN
jgi:outer membrane protein